MTVRPYRKELQAEWDQLARAGKNTSFLFERNFMDYHQDRFTDASLMVYDQDQLIAIFPANRSGEEVISHQGLTYGSFITGFETKLKPALAAFVACLEYWQEQGLKTLIFKTLPVIYHRLPADEIPWALTVAGAELYRRDASLTIDNREPLKFQTRRKRSIKKAAKLQPQITSGSDPKLFEDYWQQVLVPNMAAKHGLKPVHSLEEILQLAAAFPENIVQYNVYLQGEIQAGATMFLNPNVAHAQYISGHAEGRRNGCLDYLFGHLIEKAYQDYRYFDFGNSNEEAGTKINEGLLDWKEGFGGRAMVHDFYRLPLAQSERLQNYLI
jgi:hypothetical protein